MKNPSNPNYAARLLVGFCFAALLFLASPGWAQQPPSPQPLLRFPDIHGDTVVFVHGEDIWKANVKGGVAQRLTIHEGEERFPKFSPDGTLIAFTGDYDGNADVYIMDTHGGAITRITYHPGYDQVVGWHPHKNKIMFSSNRHSYSRFSRLFLISPDGSGLEELILHEAAFGSFSADGAKIAYNKVAREHRTWKRYQGGLAQEIYLYDFKTQAEKNISNFRGTDRAPMWIGDKIFFSSDRERTLNIYEYDARSGAITRKTHHRDYDVRRPSFGQTNIVYEVGGALWVLDTTVGKTRQIPIQVKTDAPETRPYFKKVDRFITGFGISPGGNRALVLARGEVFSVPKKNGPTRNLTRDSGANDKHAVWSPDGKSIAYFSDKNGEYNLYLLDSTDPRKMRRLTDFSNGYRHNPRWSPDSKKIAFTDQTLTLFYLDVATKKLTKVDKSLFENVDVSLDNKLISDFSWSPDSRYIAYSKMDADLVYKIYIHSLLDGKNRCVSLGIFNDFSPVFSPDGNHLLFISNRRFSPTLCDFEWEMVYKKVAGIYALSLRQDGPLFLPFQSDEEEGESKKKTKGKDKAEDRPIPVVRINFSGIANRVQPLPLPRGNYRDLSINDEAVFYLDSDDGDYNRFEYRALGLRNLHAFTLKSRKAEKVIKGIEGYKLSSNGSAIVYKKGNTIGVIESSARESKGSLIGLKDLQMRIEPLKEWRQIFNEAWRMERDFYYESNMHGLDWPAMKEKYGRLLDSASCRQDIRFIVGELIGELNTSHTYVYGGDRHRRAERRNIGMLGADWEVDTTANRYRFKKIYRTAEWTGSLMPPLALPGVTVKEGDYLLAVNDIPVTADRSVYSYFQNLAGKQTTLLVNDKPGTMGAREVRVKPVRGEYTLRYQDWLERNRRLVEEKSGGKIGYIHLPDTYMGSAREFPKYFYSQTRKQGLIIDGRFNGGGLDPDIFLQRLNKKTHSYWTRRYSHDQTSPSVATRAHMVLLTNRQAGSGGDELPQVFQFHKMGPVIGTRTWGGLVGVSMFIRMIDGGGLTAPDYRIYNAEGKWIIENYGVKPDIEVDQKVAEMARGYDAQLMTGIEYLLKKIQAEPRPWPKHEPFRVDN